MPGYLTDPASYAAGIAITASGNISAPNVQSAIYELDSEKAPSSGIAQSAITNLVSDLSAKAPLASPTFTGTVSASVANVSSNLTVDTNTLFVDAANNKVGIGTISPTQTLQVDGISFLNGKVVAGREDNASEGGQISLSRSTDNGEYWNIDVYGNTSTPSLRFHNDGTVKMQIGSSGRLSVPYQPSFYAIKTTSTAANTTITGHDIVQVNVGSCFNASTGRFTAPIAGVYLIIHSQLGNNTAIDIYLQKNGVSVAGWWNRPSNAGGDYDLSERTVICSLAANDYVSVLGNKTLYSDINGWTTFAGYLLG